MVKNILETIVAAKKKEVAQAKATVSTRQLEKGIHFQRTCLSLSRSLSAETATGIIAEFKRKSPSKGIFNADASPAVITKAYSDFGASGLSVLTDTEFFGGSKEDLLDARANQVPILRKDFVIDEYQVIEAKSMGADVILLIAACLSPTEVNTLASFARSLGLEVLLEIHQPDELDHICEPTGLLGVNNRDLKTFTVDINRSLELSDRIPADKIKISESGINDVSAIALLKKSGFKGFLIGETFMREKDPAIAFARFVHQLKNGQHESKSVRNDATGTS